MEPIHWKPIELTTRDGLTQPAEQGEIEVPEDRFSGGTIRLRFVRIKASREPQGPPVLFLSGGPGDSGIQWASHGPFLKVFQRVSEDVDLILVDQRGSGASERKLSVPPPSLSRTDLVDEASLLALAKRHVGVAADRYREEGTPLGAYNVLESAADLDALRQALGVPTVSLWGYSYGTHLAQMTTKLFPNHVERVALCCFEGPNQTFKFPSNMDAQLRRIDLLAPGFLEDVRRAHDRLAKEPIDVDGVLFGKAALQHLCASWCGISNRFTRLPAIYRSVAEGNADLLRRNMKDYLRIWAKPLVFYTTDAASGATVDRWDRIYAEARGALLGNAANFPFPSIGDVVGARDMGDVMRQPVVSDLSFLLLTGTLDGFTPTSNALEGIRTLPNAYHLLVENAAHNDLISSPTAVEAISAFVATGRKPEIDKASAPLPSFDLQ